MYLLLEPAEVDTLINGLAELPWRRSNDLIQKIFSQANDKTLQSKELIEKKAEEESKNVS
jgi:hypothetical protein